MPTPEEEELRRQALMEAYPWMHEGPRVHTLEPIDIEGQIPLEPGFERVTPENREEIMQRAWNAENERRAAETSPFERGVAAFHGRDPYSGAPSILTEEGVTAAREALAIPVSGALGAFGESEGLGPTIVGGISALAALPPGGESPGEAFTRARDHVRSELNRIHQERVADGETIDEDVAIIGGLDPLQAIGGAYAGRAIQGIGSGIRAGMGLGERVARTAGASAANAGIAGTLTGAAESRGETIGEVAADAARQGLFSAGAGALFGTGSELVGSAAAWLGRKMGVLDRMAPIFRRLESLGFTRSEINNMTDDEAIDIVQRSQAMGMARGPGATVHSNLEVAEEAFPRAAADYEAAVRGATSPARDLEPRMARLRAGEVPDFPEQTVEGAISPEEMARRIAEDEAAIAGRMETAAAQDEIATVSPRPRNWIGEWPPRVPQAERALPRGSMIGKSIDIPEDLPPLPPPLPRPESAFDERLYLPNEAGDLARQIEQTEVGAAPDNLELLGQWLRERGGSGAGPQRRVLEALDIAREMEARGLTTIPREPRVSSRVDILDQPAPVRGDPRRVSLRERLEASSGPGTTASERQLASGAEEAMRVIESRRHYPEGVRMADLPEVRTRIDASRAGSSLSNRGEGYDLVDAALARSMKDQLDRFGQEIGDPTLGARFRDAAQRYRVLSQVQPALDRARREGRPIGTRLESTIAGGGHTTGSVAGFGLHTILRSFDPSIRATVMELMQRDPMLRRWVQEKGPATVVLLAHVLRGDDPDTAAQAATDAGGSGEDFMSEEAMFGEPPPSDQGEEEDFMSEEAMFRDMGF